MNVKFSSSKLKYSSHLEKRTHYFPWSISLHYDLTREDITRSFVLYCQSRYIVYRAPSLIIYQRQAKKGKKKTDQCEKIEHLTRARDSKTKRIVRPVRFCIAVSLYPVWADVDAIYQVLKQAGEIRGNSTNSPPTPPTAEHPPSGAAPSSARASSHPCSSSTSGKAHQEFLPTLERRTSEPRKFSHEQWRIACTTFVGILRKSRISCCRVSLLNFIYKFFRESFYISLLNCWILLNY